MEIFGFVLSVWAAIGAGIFILLMIAGCSLDRHDSISMKWWVFVIGTAAVAVLTKPWLDWQMFLARDLWVYVGTYLVVGLVYSGLEFFLNVRRAARKWADKWASFKTSNYAEFLEKEHNGAGANSAVKNMAKAFIERWSREYRGPSDIIGVRVVDNVETTQSPIEPYVNRITLARNIGSWTIFWPFYAISMIIGDLLMEVFHYAADFMTYISGRFVRMSFKNVFKL